MIRECKTCRYNENSAEQEPCKTCSDNEHVGIPRGEWEPCPERIRIMMAERGWMSEDRLTNIAWGDKIGYSICFFRWDWHGIKLGNKVSIHGHCTDFGQIGDLVAETAQRALEAWEAYPGQVPVQTFGNKVVQHKDVLQPPEFRKGAN